MILIISISTYMVSKSLKILQRIYCEKSNCIRYNAFCLYSIYSITWYWSRNVSHGSFWFTILSVPIYTLRNQYIALDFYPAFFSLPFWPAKSQVVTRISPATYGIVSSSYANQFANTYNMPRVIFAGVEQLVGMPLRLKCAAVKSRAN